MSRTRVSTLPLVVLALVLWAGTAFGQGHFTAAPNPVNLGTYLHNSETVLTTTFTVTADSAIRYTVTGSPDWFTVVCGNGAGGTAGPSPTADTCTVTLNLVGADGDPGPNFTYTLTLSDGTDSDILLPVNMTRVDYTFTGPSSGLLNTASASFTVTPNAAYTGNITITPAGGGLSTPVVLTFSNPAVAQTFTVTPTAVGPVVLTPTNDGSLADPSALSYATPSAAPDTPAATAGNGFLSVTFTAVPTANNGGSSITLYTATCTGNKTGAAASSPITVSNLTNGSVYTCTVTATNGAGDSVASGASNPVTPLAPASSYSFIGPGSGMIGVASGNFTVTPNAAYTGTVTITPSGGGLTSANAQTLTFSGTSTAQTLTFTPSAAGPVTLSSTNNGSLAGDSSLTYNTNPSAPTIGVATPGNASATVAYTASASTGGSAITGYTATCNPGAHTGTGASPISVSGLTNATQYTCSVAAANSVGSSAASGTVTVTPVAPASSYSFIGPGSGMIGVASSNFTVTPSGPYTGSITITPSGGGLTSGDVQVLSFSGTSTAQTLTFTPSAPGPVTLASTNGGSLTGDTSLTYNTNPSAPTIGVATPGNASATVAYTASASTGGSAITGYTATCNPGTHTGTGASPINVTGLTNATQYTCSVAAANSVGSSAASGTVTVTPVAPANSYSFSGPGSGMIGVASSNFTVTPSGPYTGTITITPSGGGLTSGDVQVLSFSGTSTAQTVTFTPSAAGPVTLASTNSGSLTGDSSLTYNTNPSAPTIGVATPGNASATVAYTASASTGGSAITGYTATCNPGTHTGAGASPISVSGLTNGTQYTCSVAAANSVGSSAASSTVTVTPLAPAGGYTFSGPATGLLNTLSGSFTVTPSGLYTGTITITLSGGGLATTRVLTFSNSAVAQTFTITPTAVGPVVMTPTNSGSLTDPAILNYATPSLAPAIGAVTPGNASALVAFTAPASTGGSTITGYTATCNPGAHTGNSVGTASPIAVGSLTNGTQYTCSVIATNAAGPSVASGVSSSVTPALGQPLVPTPASVPLSFTKGTVTLTPNTSTIKVASGAPTTTFALDQTTVPVWLSVTGLATAGTLGADSTTGITVSFAGSSATVLQGMANGNYTANVGFLATGASAANELKIPVTMTISDTSGALSLAEGAGPINLFTPPATQTVPVPIPVVTPRSNAGPMSFGASCSVTSAGYSGSTPCKLTTGVSGFVAATPITGVAYNTGTPISTIFDSALFTGRPLGTVVTLTLTITTPPVSPTQTLNLVYNYTLQNGAVTLTAVSPTSVQSNLATQGDPLVVTLTGANFVAPSTLAAGSQIVGTQVFLGAAVGATGGTNLTANSVVLNSTTIMVSIPTADFPVSPAKTLLIGVANQQLTDPLSGPAKPQATYTVNFTTSPVIYAITSTASYIQPSPGGNPNLAPYELISIFGANFGVSNQSPNDTKNGVGTTDAYGKYLATVNASGAGTTALPYVALSVSFKNVNGKTTTTYAAPILFANATQINAIVPSQVPLTGVTTVTVTYGKLASDGLFAVTMKAADPGIFTLASSGTGQGAILNDDYSVNGSTHKATAGGGHYVSIYMTGLGAPDSTADDLASQTPPSGFPAACVAVTNPAKNHAGYMEDVNTKVAANVATSTAAYTPPTPAWTNMDGAVINPARIVANTNPGTGLFPPCFQADGTTDTVTVTFGSGANTATAVSSSSNSPILWAGFGDGSVAGLYQINVLVPASLAGLGSIPVQLTLTTAQGTFNSQVVSMFVQ